MRVLVVIPEVLGNFDDLVKAYKKNPNDDVAIGGGSVPGGMDHLVAAMASAVGADPTRVKYIPFDAGGKAMAALLSGEINALSTGFSEAVAMEQPARSASLV